MILFQYFRGRARNFTGASQRARKISADNVYRIDRSVSRGLVSSTSDGGRAVRRLRAASTQPSAPFPLRYFQKIKDLQSQVQLIFEVSEDADSEFARPQRTLRRQTLGALTDRVRDRDTAVSRFCRQKTQKLQESLSVSVARFSFLDSDHSSGRGCVSRPNAFFCQFISVRVEADHRRAQRARRAVGCGDGGEISRVVVLD